MLSISCSVLQRMFGRTSPSGGRGGWANKSVKRTGGSCGRVRRADGPAGQTHQSSGRVGWADESVGQDMTSERTIGLTFVGNQDRAKRVDQVSARTGHRNERVGWADSWGKQLARRSRLDHHTAISHFLLHERPTPHSQYPHVTMVFSSNDNS